MTCQNCGNELAPTLKFCPKCGTPASVASYAPPANEMPSSWSANPQYAPPPQPPPPKRKSRVGKVLLIIGIVLVLLAGAVGAAIYFGYRYLEQTIKSSDAYALAEAKLRESEAVKARLGVIKSTGFPIGSFKEQADGSGNAFFTMSVAGEKASGQYIVTMVRARSVWSVERAFVKLAGDEIIDVVDPAGKSGIGDGSPDGNANENSNAEVEPQKSNSNSKSPVISGGVINGKAVSKPEPPYPPAAKAARAQGTVNVEVIVDEEGKVTSANAVSGHPLLHPAAVSAARQARFSPTLLSGKPVKVKGILTYQFVLEE